MMIGDIFMSSSDAVAGVITGNSGKTSPTLEISENHQINHQQAKRNNNGGLSDYYCIIISGVILVIYLLVSGSLWPFLLKAALIFALLFGTLLLAFHLTDKQSGNDGQEFSDLTPAILPITPDHEQITDPNIKISTKKPSPTKDELLKKGRLFRRTASYYHSGGFFAQRDMANSHAAECFQAAYNSECSPGQVNLNGLHILEAKQFIEQRLQIAYEQGFHFAKITFNKKRKRCSCCIRAKTSGKLLLKWPIAEFVRRHLRLACYEHPFDVDCLIVILK